LDAEDGEKGPLPMNGGLPPGETAPYKEKKSLAGVKSRTNTTTCMRRKGKKKGKRRHQQRKYLTVESEK